VVKNQMLYCPKCGDAFKETESGGFICERGQMELSERMSQSLSECYVENKRRPKTFNYESDIKYSRIGGSWFCPGCGVPINETSPAKLICEKCDKNLLEFIYQLVELHPHL
jgi:DNA-directed RNA polymerase subunit M/transcription elongation factor TFIIS